MTTIQAKCVMTTHCSIAEYMILYVKMRLVSCQIKEYQHNVTVLVYHLFVTDCHYWNFESMAWCVLASQAYGTSFKYLPLAATAAAAAATATTSTTYASSFYCAMHMVFTSCSPNIGILVQGESIQIMHVIGVGSCFSVGNLQYIWNSKIGPRWKFHMHFRLVLKSAIWDDCEWPLPALLCNNVFVRDHHENLNEVIPTVSRQYKVFADICGVPWRGGVKQQWNNMLIFSASSAIS